jgi:hypothetical protein
LSERPLDILGAVVGIMIVKALRVLGEDRRLGEVTGQPLPEEDVRIEVDERPVLKAVREEFTQGPPARIDVVQPLQFRRDVGKAETELIDEQLLAGPIGDQNRVGIMLACGLYGESPSQ